ncbi:MAG: DUF4157 domain-containing protein [Bacteroidetes bacterium]|nr:DUF4157 domain-containing protein [Bacteroidota bacterium]
MKTKVNRTADRNKSSTPFFASKNSTGFLGMQAKLTVGKPEDKYEVEADTIADKVVNHFQSENQSFFGSENSSPVQRQPNISVQEKPLAENISPFIQRQEEEEEEAQAKLQDLTVQKQEEEMLQTQPIEEEEELLQPQVEEEGEEIVMPKADTEVAEPQYSTEQLLKNTKGNGSPLDPETQSQMENSFGANFGGVKIHTDNTSVQLNKELGSQAFTTGNNIYFNEGKYKPESQNGKKLLAHELTHTVQQGAVSTQTNGTPIQRWPWSTRSPEEIREEQKREFRNRNYGPLTYTRTEISGSGFEAKYYPRASRLNVTVRGKMRFADTLVNNGGTYSSSNYFMQRAGFINIMNNLPAAVQSRILPYFQWTDEQKQIHLIRFRQNLQAAGNLWQNTGMSFQVDETGWEDVTATPNININITQGEAVHRTRPGGFFNLFTVTDESTSDHVQVEIVKQPTASDFANVRQIITEHNAATGASVTGGMVRGVRSYLGNDPGSRDSAPQGFNNLMSLESDRMDDPSNQRYRTSVRFENNENELSGSARGSLDNFFSDPNILLDNSDRDVDVDLQGFASAPGSTIYNRSLVESRIDTVENYIDNRIINSNINTNVWSVGRTNDSDSSAETDLAANPATHDPADFRKVDVTVNRQGRGGQNVFAHELGHVFGLGDEYAEVGNGYNRPAGSAATHDQLAKNAGVAGGATVGDDNRMMSTGNQVGAAHYSTFADALSRLTSKRWKIITS